MNESKTGPAARAGPIPVEPAPLFASPVDIRSASLLLIAVLASVATLYLARTVFVPLVVGALLSYALTPLVDRLVKFHVPRALAAAVLLCSIVAAVGTTTYSLRDDTVSLIEALPEMALKLRRALDAESAQGPTATIEKLQRAVGEIERSTETSDRDLEPDRDVAKVQIERPKVNVKDYLLPGTLGLVGAAGMIAVILFLAFFLLASGDSFRRKMMKLAGPTLSEKKLTLHALDEIDSKIQRYMLVQVLTSSLVGLATWLVFLWIGIDHAAVWGAVAFVSNFIPYLGSIFMSGAAMLAGFVQFGTFEMALVIGGASLLIHSVEGYLLTPWLTSRSTRMNPVAIFAGVLFWGWLWGIWGLFLGVPILVVIKVVCDRVEEFRAVGELLGE